MGGKAKPLTTKDVSLFLMDDKKSVADRRAQLADMIRYAVDNGARAVVMDIFFVSQTPNDDKLIAAFEYANRKGIPVFADAPLDGESPRFTKDIKLGHAEATATNISLFAGCSNEPRNPNSFDAKDENGQLSLPNVVLQKLYYAGMELDGKYTDISKTNYPAYHSYNDYANVKVGGTIVFIGGTVLSGTGEEVDVVTNDDGDRTHGVYDIISSIIYFSQFFAAVEVVKE